MSQSSLHQMCDLNIHKSNEKEPCQDGSNVCWESQGPEGQGGFVYNGVLLTHNGSDKSLGVILDPALLLEKLADAATGKGILPTADIIPWIAMVILKVDYCSIHYMGLPIKKTWKRHLGQHATTLLLSGAKQNPHITHFLLTLHWLPITYQVQI